ncbi:MAG: dTDP-4-dehydrorhamnose reductase [Anaerolineales bacterium]|nr:dTDP-4-dehydrorhamnose reductase [Anaerolineales bacterium]
MRVLLFGSGGQLGSAWRALFPEHWDTVSLDYPDVDLADPDSIKSVISNTRPQLIINAAAYTAVDRAEQEPELAERINTRAPGVIGSCAEGIHAAVLHYSTDYVFNGRKGHPYAETDTPDPLNVYGRTKLEGENRLAETSEAAITLRTSWVYTPGGSSFPDKVLQWAHRQEILQIVEDQISGPTSAWDLARSSLRILEQAEGGPYEFFHTHKGIYHLAGEPVVSRYEWAQAVLALDPDKENRLCKEVRPVLTGVFPAPAERPLFTGLDCPLVRETFGLPVLDWEQGLNEAFARIV